MNGMKVLFLFIAVLFLTQITGSRGTRCFSCDRVPYPRDCNHVTTCGAHEVCLVTQIVTDSGLIVYDTGCTDKARCALKRSSSRSSPEDEDTKGDIKVCLECCQEDYCNLRGCGSPPPPKMPESRGPICFNCPLGVVSPEQCDLLTGCGRDEQCFLEQFTGLGGDTLYRGGCKSSKCEHSELALIGKREASCMGCCTSDFCNNNCSRVSETSTVSPTPVLTTTKLSSSTMSSRSTTGSTILSTSAELPSTTTNSNQFHKELECTLYGYVYLEKYEVCVKPYTNLLLSWHDARDICARDGGDLLVLHDAREEDYFDNWLLNINGSDAVYYWIGATDLEQEGTWKWVDNTSVDHSLFFIDEPNNYLTGEDCGAFSYMTRDKHGLINDLPCSMKNLFICEIKLSGTTEPHPPRRYCRNRDYTYDPQHGICFKIYDQENESWDDSRVNCLKKNADLLRIRTSNVEDYFLNLVFRGHEFEIYSRRFWVGAHRWTDGKLYWLSGRPVDTHTVHWAFMQPDNMLNAEDCVELTHLPRGSLGQQYALNDNRCDVKSHYICEERCPDTTYSYAPGLDMCYKIYNTSLNWKDAQNVCSSEHADLVEPRNRAQLDFFNVILKTTQIDTYLVGAVRSILPLSTFYWQTSNTSINADLWHLNTPNSTANHCASMLRKNNVFLFNDVSCTKTAAFICQYIW